MATDDINADFDQVIAVVRDRLSRNRRIRRTLPGEGRLRLDRQLPFLCVYRLPNDRSDPGTRDLVTTEAAYLFASAATEYAAGIGRLCRVIGETIQEHFGVLLILELWADDADEGDGLQRRLDPGFKIIAPECNALASTMAALEASLREVKLQGVPAEVVVERAAHPAPPGLSPLTSDCRSGCVSLGIGVRTVFRDSSTQAVFPILLQSLRRQLSTAIRKAVFAFTGRSETDQPTQGRVKQLSHYQSLGPSALSRAGRDVDQQLCEISQSFEFLLFSTPVNSEAAWDEFAASRYRRLPTLYYRPLPYHPTLIKRQLYSIPLEHVEDSSLAHLFEQKQDELGQQLDALKHIGTRAYFYDSLQLHGKPDDELVQLADDILVSSDQCDEERPGRAHSSDQIAAAAREHIDFYHQRLPDFAAKVQITGGIASSLMVAHDQLLISESASIRPNRLEPLLHHEVGTHLLTYFNGRQQPLRLLYAGFPGYESLQEGLAVLAEYFVGGLTMGRTRTLAARVAAVRSLVEGATFVETFDLLHRQRGIAAKTAFMTTLRVFRGGGLTKDALYLKGLRDLLAHLRAGHDLEPLYVGKIALNHVSLIRELRRRAFVTPPALLPKFWDDPAHQQRLEMCRRLSLLDLLESSP
jgi:uncharacterized protein (TIGR02421 family)